MSFEVDTATNFLDLLDRVKAFAVSEGWAVHRSTYNVGAGTDGELIMGAPGLMGGQNIICAIRSTRNVPADRFNWEIKGARQFANEAWASIPMASTSRWLPLWNNSIPYWLVCNGQRLAMVAKVSTVYMHLYMGLIKKTSTYVEYDYPLFIAGSSTADIRWSDQGTSMGAWWRSGGGAKPADLWLPTDVWAQVVVSSSVIVAPWQSPNTFLTQLTHTNGDYPLFPAVLIRQSGPRGDFGEVQGIRYTTGSGAGTEDVVTIGGTDFVVFQDTFRNTVTSYCALELA
jgi:hypothetical protein